MRRASWRMVLAPLASLGRAIRPLVLPVIAVLVVGTFKLSWPVRVLGLAAGGFVGLGLILRPELRWLGIVLEWAEVRARRSHVVVIVGLGALAVPVALAARDTVAYFATIGGFASFLLVFALALWVGALGLRLAGNATSWVRVGLGVVLGGALVRLAMVVGFLPGDAWLGTHAPWVEPGLLGGAGVLIVLESVLRGAAALVGDRKGAGARLVRRVAEALTRDRWGDRRVRAMRLRRAGGRLGVERPLVRPVRVLRELGLTMALAAAAVLGGSGVYALVALANLGARLPRPGVPADGRPIPAPGGMSDTRLADLYSPVLAFTRDERWSPVRVDGYLREATVEETGRRPGSLAGLPRACPTGRGSPCYHLALDCPAGNRPCAHPRTGQPAGPPVVNEPAGGAAYVRVVHMHPSGPERSVNRFGDLSILIEYWLFYYYDEWESPVFAGLLTQRHEGDWEVVTVGLSNRRPLFVGYSEHCGGTWEGWPAVAVSDNPGFTTPTHPLVAVARGSHANYPSAGEERSPDWARCAGAPANVATLISYSSNIRDKTEYGWLWHPPPGGLILVGTDTPPMSFPGWWGRHDETVLANFRDNRIVSGGPGPLTPSLQGPWQDPVRSIFCGYDRPAGERVPAGCDAPGAAPTPPQGGPG
ncbi:MAG: Vacuolar protein sorting-associated protein 62 [Solirubrobacteraceae bacterium]|nr:Vacuolar protein sorting-associated protein 62 [Solirubrobacteraceae bacterium]